MNRSHLLLLSSLFVVLTASPVLAAGPSSVRPFERFSIPTTEGAKPAMFTPGTSGESVLVLPDLTAYRLVPVESNPTPAPAPTPKPVPVPDPVVPSRLARIAADTAAGLPAGERVKVADVFDALAAQVAAGTIKTSKVLIAATGKAREAALGSEERVAAWRPWTVVVGGELKAEMDAGRLNDMESHRKAWGEVAKGLRQAGVLNAPTWLDAPEVLEDSTPCSSGRCFRRL